MHRGQTLLALLYDELVPVLIGQVCYCQTESHQTFHHNMVRCVTARQNHIKHFITTWSGVSLPDRITSNISSQHGQVCHCQTESHQTFHHNMVRCVTARQNHIKHFITTWSGVSQPDRITSNIQSQHGQVCHSQTESHQTFHHNMVRCVTARQNHIKHSITTWSGVSQPDRITSNIQSQHGQVCHSQTESHQTFNHNMVRCVTARQNHIKHFITTWSGVSLPDRITSNISSQHGQVSLPDRITSNISSQHSQVCHCQTESHQTFHHNMVRCVTARQNHIKRSITTWSGVSLPDRITSNISSQHGQVCHSQTESHQTFHHNMVRCVTARQNHIKHSITLSLNPVDFLYSNNN